MGFDDTDKRTPHDQPIDAERAEPLSLVGLVDRPVSEADNQIQPLPRHSGADRSEETRRSEIRFPFGHPSVGAGSPYSDIIRDDFPNDIRFHLGPRILRGDAVPLPTIEHHEIPTTAVPAVSMENVGNASADFAKSMREQIDALPAPVRKLLAEKGITVVVTDKMIDGAPDLKGQHPRGWPAGTTTENEDGAFRPDKRQIMVAETFKDSNDHDVRSDRAEGVVRHETGHGVDAALDNFSQKPEFKLAFDKDVAAMPADVKKKLEYLLQADGAGQQETFAEVFASIYGGSTNSSQTEMILKNFPSVADLMRKTINALPQ